VLLTGCYAPIESFDSNRIYAKRMELETGIEMQPALEEVREILDELFGTPDQPKWPEFLVASEELGDLVSVERLTRAAGPISSDEEGTHFGLYRKHCIACHGTSGDGLGATSRLLNPYPRDFRLGKFKTKSTPIGIKPTREDLQRVLLVGIPGTSMAAFDLLEEEDIDALIDYVIYLSTRGEVERALLTEAAYQLDYDAGERLLQPELAQSEPEAYKEQQQLIESFVVRVARNWSSAAQQVPEVTGPPAGFPIVGAIDSQDSAAVARLASSVEHGRELFQGGVASCAKCHGLTAMGDGMTQDFDDWTKDWSVAAGLDPNDKESLRPMLELGALKPTTIHPRNLRSGVYRGGGRPIDLYYRIVHGIEGTPMPAVPLKPENELGLSETDVWDLVNYLLNLPLEPISVVSSQSVLGESFQERQLEVQP
jgi:mono/diheme cytochrome c family protein